MSGPLRPLGPLGTAPGYTPVRKEKLVPEFIAVGVPLRAYLVCTVLEPRVSVGHDHRSRALFS